MPTSRVKVLKVPTPLPTSRPGKSAWLFDCENERGFLEQYHTVSPLFASLLDRAHAKNFWVDVVWKDTRYGRDVVNVDRPRDDWPPAWTCVVDEIVTAQDLDRLKQNR